MFSASSKFVTCTVSLKMAMGWLTAKEKKLVRSMADFFEIEKEEWSLIDVENVHRTATACVSESTVKCRRDAKPLKETRPEMVVKAQPRKA